MRKVEHVKPNAKLIGFLAAGHLVIDMNQGALPAILPYMKTALGLSYAATGVLVLVSNLTSSIVQPVFGHLADRTVRRWMLPVALLLSGTGLALTGFSSRYLMLATLIAMMGLGVAAYHPEGFKTVGSISGSRKTTAMSWFSLGGNLGYALGPLAVTALVTELGIYGTAGMLAPCLAVGLLLFSMLPQFSAAESGANTLEIVPGSGQDTRRGLALLIFIVMLRSWTQLGFVTFIPFYYIDHLKAAPRLVGPLLFLFLGAGAVGNLASGPVADRWGTRNVMIWGSLASILPGALYLRMSGPWATVMLGVFGALLFSTFSATIVLGQQYLPSRAGLASGLIAGFAIGAGGVGVTCLGWIADHFGLLPALWISALLPIPGFLASVLLPQPARQG